MLRSEGLGVPLGGSRGLGSASGGLRGLGSASGGLWGACGCKIRKCPKSYYTEQFEKYGLIRDKYDTTYNMPTPYDPSLGILET
jgi:hypothetical protein